MKKSSWCTGLITIAQTRQAVSPSFRCNSTSVESLVSSRIKLLINPSPSYGEWIQECCSLVLICGRFSRLLQVGDFTHSTSLPLTLGELLNGVLQTSNRILQQTCGKAGLQYVPARNLDSAVFCSRLLPVDRHRTRAPSCMHSPYSLM